MPKTKSFKSFLLCLYINFLSNCNGCLIALQKKSLFSFQMFLTALGLYHDPEDLTAEDIGTGYQWDTSR